MNNLKFDIETKYLSWLLLSAGNCWLLKTNKIKREGDVSGSISIVYCLLCQASESHQLHKAHEVLTQSLLICLEANSAYGRKPSAFPSLSLLASSTDSICGCKQSIIFSNIISNARLSVYNVYHQWPLRILKLKKQCYWTFFEAQANNTRLNKMIRENSLFLACCFQHRWT